MATQEQILSDHEIIELYWQRNENAIVQTDLKYHGFLMNVAQMILHNLQDSEECLNDTYLRTWNVIPPTRPTMLRAFWQPLCGVVQSTSIAKTRTAAKFLKVLPFRLTT